MRRTLAVLLVFATFWAGGVPGGETAVAGVPRGAPDPSVMESNAQALADYTVGVFLLESGSELAAIPHLESAWEKSARDETMGAKLAEAYFAVGDLTRCEAICDELLSMNAEHTAALLHKAKIAYVGARKEEAAAYLERIESAGEPSFEIQRILASVYTELAMSDKALAAYERALKIDPSQPVMQLRYGEMLRDAGKLDEAAQALRAAMKLRPGFPEAGLALAAMARQRGADGEAEAALAEVLEADASNTEALDAITDLYVEKGELDKAIRLLESSRQRSVLPDEALVVLGKLYYEVKDYNESLAVFEEIFEAGRSSADLARILGEISTKARKKDKALQYYREAVRLGPRDYRNHLALFVGSSATFTRDEAERIALPAEESLRALEEASKIVPPGDAEALYLVGVAYQSVDSLAAARRYLGRAAEIRPEDERIVLNLASVLEKMERYEEAERHLAALHAKQPDDPTTCNFYGYLLALMGKELDKAEKLVRKALEAEPENGYYIDSLGWVFFVRGDFDRAVAELERAAQIVENDPVILEHLGDARRAVGRYSEAAAAYEKSQSLQGGDTGNLARKILEVRKQARE